MYRLMQTVRCVAQVAGGDSGWSCVGENVLDVLVEMDRERQRSEKVQK